MKRFINDDMTPPQNETLWNIEFFFALANVIDVHILPQSKFLIRFFFQEET